MQAAKPIIQSSMVTSDQVSQDVPRNTKAVDGQHGTRCRMRSFTSFPLDVRVCLETTDEPDVFLKTRAELPQIVPTPCNSRQIRTKPQSKLGG